MLHTQKFTLPRLIGLLPFVGLLLILMGPSVAHAAGGTVWASRTSAADNNWISVTYGNGLFVAVSATGAGNRVMTSPDGIIWTIRTFSRALFNAVFPHPNWEINAADYASDFHPVDLKAQSWSFKVRGIRQDHSTHWSPLGHERLSDYPQVCCTKLYLEGFGAMTG